MGKVDDIMRRRKVDDLMRRRAGANRSFLGWTRRRGEEGSKTTDRTRRILVWAILVAAGLALAAVIAWVWGVQQLTASRVPADMAAVLKLMEPAPDVKLSENPAKKGWKKLDVAKRGGLPDFVVGKVEREPFDPAKPATSYRVSWSVMEPWWFVGCVSVPAGEGWEYRATQAIRAEIAKKLAGEAEEAKAKAAVEKASKQP